MRCMSCGKEVSANDAFCPVCGHKLSDAATNRQTVCKKKSRTKLAVVILCVTVAVGVSLITMRKIFPLIEHKKDTSDIPITSVISDADTSTYSELFEQAIEYSEDFDWGNAEICLTKALQLELDMSELYYALAEVYVQQSDLYRAWTVLQNGYRKTGDDSLQKASIWGPISSFETIMMYRDKMPAARCEYLFANDRVLGCFYYNGIIDSVIEYFFENEQITRLCKYDLGDSIDLTISSDQLLYIPIEELGSIDGAFFL